MQNYVEKGIMALIAIAVLLALIGLVAGSSGVTNAGIIVLMIAAIAYCLVQLIMYWKNSDAAETKPLLWGVIISVAIALVIFVLGVLLITGKLLPNGFFGAIENIKF